MALEERHKVHTEETLELLLAKWPIQLVLRLVGYNAIASPFT